MENKLKQLGIHCPGCNSFIYIPLEQILFATELKCKACSLTFTPNKTSCEQLLKQLQETDFVF